MTDDNKRLSLEAAWEAASDECWERAHYLEIIAVEDSYQSRLQAAVDCDFDYFPREHEPFRHGDNYCRASVGDMWDHARFDFWDAINCRGACLIHAPYKELETIFEFIGI